MSLSGQLLEPAERPGSAARRLDELGAESLAWLVLPPAWTEALALASGFPTGSRGLDELLALCEAVNWCARRPTTDGGVPPEARAELLASAAAAVLHHAPPDVARRVVDRALSALAALPAEPQVEGVISSLHAAAADREPSFVTGPGDRPATVPAAADSAVDELAPLPATTMKTLVDASATALPGLLVPWIASLPTEALAALVARCAREAEPRAAARLLVSTSTRLPPGQLRDEVAVLMARLPERSVAAQTALSHLATASAAGGEVALALDIVERLTSDRSRARALAAIAGALASVGAAGVTALSEVIDRLVRALSDGTDVDLPVAAEAAERLASAGATGARVLSLAESALGQHTRRGSEVPALVRLAGAAQATSTGNAARFTRAALEAARAEGDPAVRSAGLIRLAVANPSEAATLASEALHAARAIVADHERAEALAQVVPHLPDPARGEIFDELVALCAPDRSRYSFWVPDVARSELLAQLRERLGTTELRRVAADIGAAVLASSGGAISLPAVTRRWATLAAALRADDPIGSAAGDRLLERVDPLLSSSATGQALSWVESGRQLLDVVQGTFDTSVLLAQRRIEVEQRKEHDRRQLGRFLPRQEQIAAFRELLAGPDDGAWALHYLGHGGVGKTTLLRYLTAELAPQESVLVARVDFDRLSPDFPLRRPGQLLLELLEELEGYAANELRAVYVEVRERLRHLEWWSQDRSSKEEVGRAAEMFCSYLGGLGRPVVLVLDTCEELTKYQPVGAVVPQLEAAFQLVEEIHSRVPSVRVVFAGRRPLAVSGAGGWTIDASQRVDFLPARKDYLAVHEVAGFREDEAVTYLTTIEDLTLSPDVLALVLSRCVDPYHNPSLLTRSPLGPRYNAFDLAVHAAAVRENRDVLALGDVLVETRVRRRLGQRWAGLLPVVAVLRRFEQAMLATAVPVEDVELAWRELRATEWVTSDFDTVLQTVFLEIDSGLLERLDAYFTRPEARPELLETRRTLAPRLEAIVRVTPVQALSAEAVEAALRALEPVAAALLVDDLSVRVAQDSAWMWAFSVFGRVLGPDGVLGEADLPASPAAQALFATALSKVRPSPQVTAQWQSIGERAGQHPDPHVAAWLRVRAGLLGYPEQHNALATALDLVGRRLEGDRPRALWLLGTCFASLEEHPNLSTAAGQLTALAEGLEASGDAAAAAVALTLSAAAPAPDEPAGPAPTTPAGTPVGAAAFRCGRALELAERAPQLDAASAPFLAADWAAPARMRERVRLLCLERGVPSGPDWFDEALLAGPADDVDADRLAGVLLDLRLRQAVVRPTDLLHRDATAVGDLPPPVATTAVHRAAPPLRIALSRAWLALGDGTAARKALRPAGRTPVAAEVQDALDIARVDVVRRLRLDAADRYLRSSLLERPPAEVPRVVEASGLLLGNVRPPQLSDTPADIHLLWRSSHAAQALAQPALHLWPQVRSTVDACSVSSSWDEVALALDAVESRWLTDPRTGPGTDAPTLHGRFAIAWALLHPGDPEQAARLLLRALALTEDEVGWEGWRSGFLHSRDNHVVVGPRRWAELALEEGELLALRLPDHGARLLAAAADWFGQVADPVGAFIAEAAAALAAVRGERPMGVDRLETAYGRLRAAAPQLPTSLWEGVRDDSYRSNPDWEGWLIRLAVVDPAHQGRARQADERRESPSPELPGWTPDASSADPYGTKGSAPASSPGKRRRTAAEPGHSGNRSVPTPAPAVPAPRSPLAGSPRAPTPPEPPSQASPASVAPQAGRSRRGPAWLAATVAVAGLVLAILGYELLTAAVGGIWIGRLLVVRVLVLVALLLVIGWCAVLVAESGPKISGLVVKVRGEGPEYEVSLFGYRGRRWPLPDRHAHATLQVRVDKSGRMHVAAPPCGPLPHASRDADHSGAAPPGPLAAPLRSLRHPDQPLHVKVRTPPALIGLPWESFLCDQLRGLGPIDIVRDQLREGFRVGSFRNRLRDDVQLLVPEQWRDLVTVAVGPSASPVSPLLGPLGAASPELSPGDVVIVLGVPVDTAAGRRLVVPQHGKGDNADLVVEPDALRPAGAFVVVVALPTRERGPAVQSNMPSLRRCAADLVLAGAEQVVVLPSMPADLLGESLRLLAEQVRARNTIYDMRGVGELVRSRISAVLPAVALDVTELRAWL